MSKAETKYYKEFKKHAKKLGWSTDEEANNNQRYIFVHNSFPPIEVPPKITDGSSRKLKKMIDDLAGIDRRPKKRDPHKAKMRLIEANAKAREEEERAASEREELLREREEREARIEILILADWSGLTEAEIRAREAEVMAEEKRVREIVRMMTEKPGGGSRAENRVKHQAGGGQS